MPDLIFRTNWSSWSRRRPAFCSKVRHGLALCSDTDANSSARSWDHAGLFVFVPAQAGTHRHRILGKKMSASSRTTLTVRESGSRPAPGRRCGSKSKN